VKAEMRNKHLGRSKDFKQLGKSNNCSPKCQPSPSPILHGLCMQKQEEEKIIRIQPGSLNRHRLEAVSHPRMKPQALPLQ